MRDSTGAVLLVQRDEPAEGADAGRLAGLGEQHECEQPGDLGGVEHRLPEQAREVDGLAREVGVPGRSAGGRVVRLGEHHVEDVEYGGQPISRLSGAGRPRSASISRRLARVMRWAIVDSGSW